MKSEMFADLESAMKKWVSKWAEKPQWEDLDFYCPSDLELNMTKAAALVFDTAVVASKESEDNK